MARTGQVIQRESVGDKEAFIRVTRTGYKLELFDERQPVAEVPFASFQSASELSRRFVQSNRNTTIHPVVLF